MYHYYDAVRNRPGEALTGYYVKAVDTVTGSVVDIYADANSTPIISVSGLTNAAQVDSNGNVSFYIPGGTYHLDLYATDGVTFLLRVANVPMVDFTVAAGNVPDRATLAAKVASNGDAYTLTEAGREGLFIFSSSDQSSNVSSDTTQQNYVAPSSDTTGASGAWVRHYYRPGFSAGAGATVTQTTSKTTAVTINSLVGRVITTNDALASGATAAFIVNNNLVGGYDTIVANFESSSGLHGIADYAIRAGQPNNTGFTIAIVNNNASTLSEAITINFAVIKGVIS